MATEWFERYQHLYEHGCYEQAGRMVGEMIGVLLPELLAGGALAAAKGGGKASAKSLAKAIKNFLKDESGSIGPGGKKRREAMDRLLKSKKKAKNGPTTPNKKARDAVQGEYVDPMTGKKVKTDEVLSADHVFPKKEIKELPGFDKLTREQQAEVLNNLDNFQGLPKSQNSSKGSKLDWDTFKGEPLDADYASDLAQRQQDLQQQLQGQIDQFLKDN